MDRPADSEAQQRLRRIATSITDAYFEADLRGRVTFFTDAFCDLTGRKPNEFGELDLAACLSPQDPHIIEAAITDVTEHRTASPTVETIVNLNGSKTLVAITLKTINDAGGRPTGISGTARDITKTRALKKALKESEVRYRTLLDCSPYSIAITRRSDAKYVEVNEAFHLRTGFTREEVIGRTAVQLSIYDDLTQRDRLFEVLNKDGQVDGLEVRFRRKDGSLREAMVSTRPIQYGGEECLLSITMDIDLLKEYQRALRDSEQSYRAILEAAPYSIIVTRLSDSRYLEVNDAFCRRTGYSRLEALGRTPYELELWVDPSARERMLELFYRDGRVDSMELSFRAKDGRILESLFSVTPITYKGEDCLLAMTVDIGELKKTQRALSESEQRYRNILSSIEEGYWEVDLRGTFTFVNEAEARIHRCSRQELVGKNNRDFSRPEKSKEVYTVFNQIYKTGKPVQVLNYDIRREDGSVADIEMSASLLRDSSGTPIGFFGISRDVTEKRQAEKELEKYRHQLERMVRERTKALETAQKELVKKEKLAVLGQLTATVSHELRNPLGVIRSSNFYLQRKMPGKDDKIEKHFHRIEEQITACETIVADLLEYTRGRNVSMSVDHLNPWIETLLDREQEMDPIPIERHLSDDLPAVAHDQEKLRRVLINLVDNARLAVEDKQAALKGKPYAYRPLVRVSTKKSKRHVVLEITDNGIGMDEETRRHAFEPLFTTRARGTGIGLANVKKIVTEHNGSIKLTSEPGTGTKVTIKLPCPS